MEYQRCYGREEAFTTFKLVFLLLPYSVSGVNLPVQWLCIVQKLLGLYKASLSSQGCVMLDPLHFLRSDPVNVHSYFCPPVFIWDPVLSTVEDGYFPVMCTEHICQLIPTDKWMEGQDNSRLPRLMVDYHDRIYGFTNAIFCKWNVIH